MGGYAVVFAVKSSGEGRRIVAKKLLDSLGLAKRSMIKKNVASLKFVLTSEFALNSLRYFWSTSNSIFSTVFIHAALDIASSLKYLYRNTIAHHDLKPENKHFGV